MTRVKRSVHARKKRRATLERAKGFRGEAHSSYRRAKEAVMKADSYALPRSPQPQARLPPPVDHAHQRRRAPERHVLRHVHARPEAGRGRARPQGPRRHRRARRRDVPPICRRRPRGVAGLTADRHQTPPGRPSSGRRPFCFRGSAMTITSPHNDSAQGDPQARRPAPARADAAVRGRGRGPARRRGRRRLAAVSAAARPAAGSAGRRSRPQLLERRLAARLGHARARRLRAALGARADRAAVRRAVGRRRPGQRRHGAALRARVRRGAASRSGPARADPYGPKAVRASMGAIFAVPVARVRDRRRRCPADDGRARRARAGRAARAQRRALGDDGRRWSSAPSARACRAGRRSTACDRVAHIPIRSESLNAAMAATIALYEVTRVARA